MPAFSVSKSIVIQAPVDRVYEVVRDFKQWPEWSPWIIIEPDCQLEFSEDGNSYRWAGSVIGGGGMSVKGETENERIDYDLQFLKPWKSQADVRFSFRGKDGGTEVTWDMDSALPVFMFFMKKMMVALIGMDYQRGLGMMKDYIETGSVPSQLEFGRQSHEPFHVVGIRTGCPISEVGPGMEADLTKLHSWITDSGVVPAGQVLSFYHEWDIANQRTEYTIGVPVPAIPDSLPGDMVSVSVPAIDTFTITHTGRYDHLGNAWSAGMMRGRAGEFKQDKVCPPFEIYENDPRETAPEELITVVNFPLKERA